MSREHTQREVVQSPAYLVVERLGAVESFTVLVDDGQTHGLSDDEAARVRPVAPQDHVHQRALAGAVRTDHSLRQSQRWRRIMIAMQK